MKQKFTREEMNHIKYLCNCALSSPDKKTADCYIDQLRRFTNDIFGSSLCMVSEMISAVANASGNVQNRQGRRAMAEQLILKVEMFCTETPSDD